MTEQEQNTEQYCSVDSEQDCSGTGNTEQLFSPNMEQEQVQEQAEHGQGRNSGTGTGTGTPLFVQL